MANGARLVGSALAGLVIGALGEGWCSLIGGVSYFAVIASLLLMRIKSIDIRRNAASMLEQMRDGWDYVRSFRPWPDRFLSVNLSIRLVQKSPVRPP
jgi:Transmembrane secretion effector